MTKSPTVAAAGICCLDYIVTSPQVDWGETAWVSDFRMQGGGLAATGLVACARLGATCSLLSFVGDDEIGETILAELVAEGIDTERIVRVSGGQSPFSFIHVDEDTGDRTIFHRQGVFSTLLPSVNMDVVLTADALLVDNVYPSLAAEAARICRERGIPVVADIVPDWENEEVLEHVDALITSRDYALQLEYASTPEAALEEIHGLGPGIAVITLGSDGCVWSGQNGSGRTPAFHVDVVDTTGAGDAFHGAFCYGIAGGWDTDRCCEFAAAVAAIKCTQRGGRAGLPSLDRTMAFLKERGKLHW